MHLCAIIKSKLNLTNYLPGSSIALKFSLDGGKVLVIFLSFEYLLSINCGNVRK